MLLVTVKSKDGLELACRLLHTRLERRDLNHLNGMVLEAICSCILTKVLELGMGPEAIRLVEVLLERDVMPPIYYDEFQRLLSEELNSLYGVKKEAPKGQAKIDKTIEKQFKVNLDVLLKTDSSPDSAVLRSIGYSFITFSGDIIWADKNTQKLLETKQHDTKPVNLFDLMIPFSVNLLHKKFGKELFKGHVGFGSQTVLSFVIYSKTALQKYMKQLKKKNVQRLTEIVGQDEGRSIYFKYLKALSARATIVALKCSRSTLKTLQPSLDIEEGVIMPKKSMAYIRREFLDIKDEFNEPKENEPTSLAIMVELRISKNIPDFDYKKMDGDPKIEEFRHMVSKKLKDN